jgi:hypothetical protein
MKGINCICSKPMTTLLVLATVLLAAGIKPARADGKSAVAREVAEYVMQRFSRQVAKEGAETLATKIETYAARHGEEFYQAIRRAGPQAFHLVEEAGEHAPQVVRVLSRYGEEGAVWVVARPKAMNLVLKHGEDAAATLIKHPGIAEPVIDKLGQPAVRALQAVNPRNGRRVAMMLDSGELGKIGSTPELLGILEKYGDPACDFLWRNKGILAGTGVAAAFIANPSPFISGAKELTEVVAANTIKPLAEVPLSVAKESAAEMARNTNWTLVFVVLIGVLSLFIGIKWRLFHGMFQRSPASVLNRCPAPDETRVISNANNSD